MKKFLNLDLGFFGPVNDVINLSETPGIGCPEILAAANVGDSLQRRFIQINFAAHNARSEKGFNPKRRRPVPSHADCINFDTQSMDRFRRLFGCQFPGIVAPVGQQNQNFGWRLQVFQPFAADCHRRADCRPITGHTDSHVIDQSH